VVGEGGEGGVAVMRTMPLDVMGRMPATLREPNQFLPCSKGLSNLVKLCHAGDRALQLLLFNEEFLADAYQGYRIERSSESRRMRSNPCQCHQIDRSLERAECVLTHTKGLLLCKNFRRSSGKAPFSRLLPLDNQVGALQPSQQLSHGYTLPSKLLSSSAA